MKKIKVAIASDFLSSFAGIPKKQQNKVLEFINKFRSNPMSSGINYEKIVNVKDKNIRSVRIDQTYRGIVLKPKSGNVYLLLWVDHHDKAYKWAENKRCQIHPETGSLQIIEVEESIQKVETPIDESVMLFSGLRDRELIRLGVPEELIPVVREIKDQVELDTNSEKFPQEVYEALFFIAEGYSLEDVIRDMAADKGADSVDIDDFDAALDNPDSKRRFHVVEDEDELRKILSAPLEKWRVFLHPSQRKIVENNNWNGPVRVLGGAGTGKTVVAMHRAKWLVENVFTNENDKILFTTFTKNLAADIKSNLQEICTRETMRRIEVLNLDRWVAAFLKRNGYQFEIDYYNKSKPFWKQAVDMASDSTIDLSDSFYREEWEKVIQPQGINTLSDYIKASRIGRGVGLNRKARKQVWPVFEEYRALLNENNLREIDDAIHDARSILENKSENHPYRAVIVDEAQDMSSQAFNLIRVMAPADEKNNIFIVGDAHQRIYQHKVVLGQCGINIVGRSKKLKINYRTTDETRSWAVSLLKGVSIDDLDGGEDNQKGYKSLMHGNCPVVKTFGSFEEEVVFLCDYLEKNNDNGFQNICLTARTNKLLDEYEKALTEKGIQIYRVKRSEADDRNIAGLRIATMHRVKGIEFDKIIIAGVNDGVMPFPGFNNSTNDTTILKDRETRERSLLYVAATRAKNEVVVTSFGKPSKFLS